MRLPRRRPRLTESEIRDLRRQHEAERRDRMEQHPELCSACWHRHSDHRADATTIVCGVRRCRCEAISMTFAKPRN